VRVLDLLERAELGLSVAWAEPAMLEREIKGSYIIDLPRPGRFLSEGDLVLTGAQWATGPDSAEVFVSELAAKDVAVLVVGRILIGQIPDYIVTACRSRHIVLLTTSADVSFKSISHHIESAISADVGSDSRAAGFTRDLLANLASGQGAQGAQGALRMFYTEFAVDCWLLEADGTVTAMVGQAPSTERIGTVWNAALDASADVFVLPDESGRPSSVYPIVGDGTAGYLVSLGDHRTFSPDMVRVMGSLMLVIRVELELANDRRRAAERQAVELVGTILADNLVPGEAAARLRMLRADPTLPITVVTAFVDDPGYPARAVLEAVTGMLADGEHLLIGSELGEIALAGPEPRWCSSSTAWTPRRSPSCGCWTGRWRASGRCSVRAGSGSASAIPPGAPVSCTPRCSSPGPGCGCCPVPLPSGGRRGRARPRPTPCWPCSPTGCARRSRRRCSRR
jgi:hypothetical protein